MPRKVHNYPHSEVALADHDGLTQRRCEILYLAAQGLTEKEIAAELNISPVTAKSHINALRDQFNAVNRVDLISQAWAHGVLQAATKNVRMSLIRRFSEIVACPDPTALDTHAYRAESRLKNRRSVGALVAQKVVEPIFSETATGQSGFYELPIADRARLAFMDSDNRQRYSRYLEKKFRMVQGAAA